ncbi:MAG: DNA-3-methyladenine glycosylase [Anaerolineaceae bacterium]
MRCLSRGESILPPSFYDCPVVQVARRLLGMRLVRLLDGQRVSGLIVEVEAYDGEADLACHARAGRTPRTEIMYGPPGWAYIYFTYGMHWCLNCVTGPEGYPSAVLIRAIRPEEGLEFIAVRRSGRSQGDWCNGPGKLTQALEIDGGLNGVDLTAVVGGLWIETGQPVAEENVLVSPRVGIKSVPEPWRSQPWRFKVKGGITV